MEGPFSSAHPALACAAWRSGYHFLLRRNLCRRIYPLVCLDDTSLHLDNLCFYHLFGYDLPVRIAEKTVD